MTVAPHYAARRSRSALPITDTELKLIARRQGALTLNCACAYRLVRIFGMDDKG